MDNLNCLQKFLSKLHGGVFGVVNEERLFSIIEQDDAEKQRDAFSRIITQVRVTAVRVDRCL
jgi:hypothetical protein